VVFRPFFYVPILVGILALSTPLRAAQALTLEEAVDRATRGHPMLAAEASIVDATRHQAQLDGLAPAMNVQADLEQFAGTGALSGLTSAETTLSLNRTFELGGKRAARSSVGQARVSARENDLQRRRLDITALARLRFLEVLARQEHEALSRRELALAEEALTAVTERVERGASPASDLPLAELAVSRANLEVEDAEHELQTAKVALSVLWGEREPSFSKAEGELAPAAEPTSLESLAARLTAGPDQRHFELQAEMLEAEARLAAANRRPDVTGSLGVRRLEALDDEALVLSVSLPVGLGERSRLAGSRIRAQRSALESERSAAELERYEQLHAAYQEMLHALHEFESIENHMIPAAERALALAQQGYDDARYSYLQVLDGRRLLNQLAGQRIDAALRHRQLLAQVQRLTADSPESLP